MSGVDAARWVRLDAELRRWKAGVLSLNPPVEGEDLSALEEALGSPLAPDHRVALERFDGVDFRGSRMFSAAESLEHWKSFHILVSRDYVNDPDWPSDQPPPRHLLPIAVSAEGDLKCVDLSAEGEVVEWHRESGAITTWHANVASWLLIQFATLSLRFDHRGRPRAMRSGDTDQRLRELEAHLSEEPQSAYARLELAYWHAERSTPEEALFAFREAAAGRPERAINHYLHARWALLCGHYKEARAGLRRAVAVPQESNPKKHSFRIGHRAAAHKLLALLYSRVGQKRKATQEERAFERAQKRYGMGWYESSDEYQSVLSVLLDDG